MFPIKIGNGFGFKRFAKVTKEQSLYVVAQSFPTFDPQKTKPFSKKFTDENDSPDMGINGSTTPVDFFIEASPEEDRYITILKFIIGYGSTAYLFEFADEIALANGIRLYYSSIRGENEIAIIKANYDLILLRRDGLVRDWEARNFLAVNDFGYLGTIDLTEFAPPYGIKLDKGTNQRVTLTVRDNATNADLLEFTAIGFDRFEI